MTNVKLFGDIGLNMSMKRTIDFSSKAEQLAWFNKKPYKFIEDIAYNKLQNVLNIPFGPNEVIKTYEDAQTFTYALVEELEDSGKRYFCFVDNVTLIDASTLYIDLAIDPIQTYMGEFELDECMINVAHVDRWNKASTPVRITPNKDNITCFMEVKANKKINPNVTNIDMPEGSVEYVNPDDMYVVMMTYTYRADTEVRVRRCYSLAGIKKDRIGDFRMNGLFSEGAIQGQSAHRMPSLDDVIRGRLPTIFDIPTEDMLFVALLPFVNWNIYARGSKPEDGYELEVPPLLTKHYILGKEGLAMWTDSDEFCEDKETFLFKDEHCGDLAVAPTNNAVASQIYEPALYMSPYRKTCVTDGLGNIIVELPDIVKQPDEDVTLKGKILTGNSSVSVAFYVNTIATDGSIGSASVVSPVYIDVINNHWLDYYLTERTQDRQMIANNNMNAAIDNLMFMSYGGALVGSRGMSTKDAKTKNPMKNIAGKALPAIGIAAGASVVTSLVDSHYAWENQKEAESKIKNKPNGLLLVGNGQELANNITAKYHLIRLECDKTNIDRAYDRYRKYGYEINEFMKLNTKSRKFYNFVMTNGAIIKGNLNNVIKEDIAAIFDHGITIFHGDYSETLEYTDKENIERCLIE